MIRQPQVAGQFYQANPVALKKQLDELTELHKQKEDALGIVSPHAGYIFSGRVAGMCFSKIKLTGTVIILGPNHTGLGAAFSIMVEGSWQMPLGNVEIDSSLAKKILRNSRYLKEDTQAHTYEHSIEVQLPFLQFFLPQTKIVPIVVSSANFAVYDEIGRAISKSLQEIKQNYLIVASSDMTHYEPQEKAKANDNLAIEAILKLDAQELLRRIEKFNITMCGYAPCAIMLSATKELGARTARLIEYKTSGDACGDYSSVVGYAGIIVQ